MKRWIGIACALTFALAAVSIARNERLLVHGTPMLLRLAPVDPRSLMQGDYMALNFAIAQPIVEAMDDAKAPDARVAVVTLDDNGVATFVRVYRGEALSSHERLLRFQVRPSRWGAQRIQVSTDAYFFEEGQGKRYERARFGAFRVDADGNALLVGLRGDGGKPL